MPSHKPNAILLYCSEWVITYLMAIFFGVECCRNDGVKTIGWNSFNPSVGLAGFWQRMELGAILHNMLIEQLGFRKGFCVADYIRTCYVHIA